MESNQSIVASIWEKNSDDPLSLRHLGHRFIEWLKVRGYSLATLTARRHEVGFLILWCQEREITDIEQLTEKNLKNYQLHLATFYSLKKKKTLSKNSQQRFIIGARQFLLWLQKNKYIDKNLADSFIKMKSRRYLPGDILSVEEIEMVINQTDVTTAKGIRDRAILETFYSSGIRRQELMNLKVNDINFQQKIIMIREGKGKKDRVIPIGERALAWITKYLHEVRPQYVKGEDNGYLFFNRKGEAISKGTAVSDLVRKYLKAAKIKKKGACHLFRRSMATLMLSNGADIRYLKDILGHSSLETTQIYTKVSIKDLQEAHKQNHPSNKLPNEDMANRVELKKIKSYES